MTRRLTPLFALFLLLAAALPALAQGDAAAAVDWLAEQTRADGGYTDGFSESSGIGPTTDALFAAVATGEDPSTWSDPSPLDFLASQAASANTTGNLAKLLLAAVSTGQDPTEFGGVNLVEALEKQFDEVTGTYQGVLTEHAIAMLALHAAGEPIPAGATEALIEFQDRTGGWSFDGEGQPDTNTTAIAIQALNAAGEPMDSTPVVVALAFLKTQQNDDGGFPYQSPSEYGTESDANSTAWVIQGLLAADQSLEEWDQPDQFLASLQTDEGAFQWKESVEGANFLATAQAVPALAGVTFADFPVVRAAEAAEAQAEAAEAPTATPEATPDTLPTTGGSQRWGEWLALGGLLLLGAGTLRRASR